MILIDYNQIAIATFMAEIGGRKDVTINPDLLRHMIINTIRSYKTKFGNEYGDIIIACDNRHYWRKREFPFYKAHRRKTREKSEFDWGAIFDALGMVRNELDQFFPYAVIDVEGAEADDVIGTLAEYSQASGEPFLIISGDHDFQQLQKWSNVKQFSPAQKRWIKITEPASHVLMEHIITGDKGDGIPNMLSPDDCFVEGKRQRPIRKKLLSEWKAQKPEEFVTSDTAHGFNRNQLLVDLTKTPEEIKIQIISSFERQQDGDRSQLLNYFIKHKMRHMIECLGDF